MDNFNKNQDLNKISINKDKLLNEYKLTEESFYPPSDNRTFHIYASEEFEEYTEYIYDLYEEEGFYEN